mgnify:CR=1 FL=1
MRKIKDTNNMTNSNREERNNRKELDLELERIANNFVIFRKYYNRNTRWNGSKSYIKS